MKLGLLFIGALLLSSLVLVSPSEQSTPDQQGQVSPKEESTLEGGDLNSEKKPGAEEGSPNQHERVEAEEIPNEQSILETDSSPREQEKQQEVVEPNKQETIETDSSSDKQDQDQENIPPNEAEEIGTDSSPKEQENISPNEAEEIGTDSSPKEQENISPNEAEEIGTDSNPKEQENISPNEAEVEIDLSPNGQGQDQEVVDSFSNSKVEGIVIPNKEDVLAEDKAEEKVISEVENDITAEFTPQEVATPETGEVDPNEGREQHHENADLHDTHEPHDHLHSHSHSHPHSHSHDGHGGENPILSPLLDYVSRMLNINSTKEVTFETCVRYAFSATAAISLMPILLLIPIPVGKPGESGFLSMLLSFAAGGLLGDAFLHLIPHAVSPHSHTHGTSADHSHEAHSHQEEIGIGLAILIGVVVFFFIEKLIIALSGETHSHAHTQPPTAKPDPNTKTADSPPSKKGRKKSKSQEEIGVKKEARHEDKGNVRRSAYLNLIADFTHNFTDGLAIGASFLVNLNVGIITTLTILIHEIPHEVGDFAILIRSGFSKLAAMSMQAVTAIGALLGTACGLYAETLLQESTGYILGFTAGGFIYIACVSILPEMLTTKSVVRSLLEIFAFLVGIGMMVGVGLLE